MPQPSNLPSKTGQTPITLYLVNWVHEPVPSSSGEPQISTPITTSTSCALLERSGGSWRFINNVNFQELMNTNVLGARITSFERFCDQIWVGTENGYLLRSLDGGLNFDINEESPSANGDAMRYVAKDVSGRLWRADQASSGIEIYLDSIGEGNDWKLLTTIDGAYIGDGSDFSPRHCIVCHPTNSNIVAFHGSNLDSFHSVWITEDSENFTEIVLPDQADNDFSQALGDISFSDSGKLFILWESIRTDDWPLFLSYSDNYETFVNTIVEQGTETDGGFPQQLFVSGSNVWVVAARDLFNTPSLEPSLHTYLYSSLDSGVNFNQISDWLEADEMPGYPVGIWAEDTDNIYVFFDSFGYESEVQLEGNKFQWLIDQSGNKIAISGDLSGLSSLEFPHSLYGTVTRPYGSATSRGVNTPKGSIGNGGPRNIPGEVLCH